MPIIITIIVIFHAALHIPLQAYKPFFMYLNDDNEKANSILSLLLHTRTRTSLCCYEYLLRFMWNEVSSWLENEY